MSDEVMSSVDMGVGKCIVCGVHYSLEQFGPYCPLCKEEDKIRREVCMTTGLIVNAEMIMSFLGKF